MKLVTSQHRKEGEEPRDMQPGKALEAAHSVERILADVHIWQVWRVWGWRDMVQQVCGNV